MDFIKKIRNIKVRKIPIYIKVLLKRIFEPLIHFLQWKDINKKVNKIRCSSFCVFLISTPVHGNLGDQAIVYAQWRFLKELGVDNNTVEINTPVYKKYREELKTIIIPEDIIIIDGGGNIGTLWIGNEYRMRQILLDYPDNKIYIFPQTAYFENTEKGLKELRESAAVYEAHSHLTVFCRDSETYLLFRDHYKKVMSIYTPDTVLFLGNIHFDFPREGIKICFRDDCENIRHEDLEDRIIRYLVQENYEYSYTSTKINKEMLPISRKKYLYRKWKEFAKAKLIITDRLHGMLFCAITGTPCIAINNISNKVKGGYWWLEGIDYIYLCEDVETIFTNIKKVMSDPNDKSYSFPDMSAKFTEMKEEFRKSLKY